MVLRLVVSTQGNVFCGSNLERYWPSGNDMQKGSPKHADSYKTSKGMLGNNVIGTESLDL